METLITLWLLVWEPTIGVPTELPPTARQSVYGTATQCDAAAEQLNAELTDWEVYCQAVEVEQ